MTFYDFERLLNEGRGSALESEELAKFYQAYGKGMVLYAWSLTKQQSDAESLVSDAFYHLSLQKEPPNNIKFWLFQVIKNGFIDQQRHKKRWQFSRFSQEMKSSQKQPDERLIEQEQHQALYDSIEKLTPPYKEVLIFFYFLEWSIQEISSFLNLSNGQTRTILYRGRKKLKEELKND